MNEQSDKPELTEQDLNDLTEAIQKNPNQKFVQETIQANLTPEEIKELGGLSEIKSGRVEEVLLATDKQKIETYNRLNVKDLPDDWELQLARLKELEKKTAEYNQIKQKLSE
jgi:hypothetical protein